MPNDTPPDRSSAHQARLTERRSALRAECRRARTAEASWSWARLLLFAGALVAVILLREETTWSYGTGLVGLALFAWSVRRHHAERDRRAFAERLLTMVEESLRRSGGQVELIRSRERPTDSDDPLPPVLASGKSWALTDQERDDLDLYAAPVGVFGLLNRTSTAPGARRLRHALEQPCLERDHIHRRQAAVRWLEEHGEQRLRLMAAASVLRGRDQALDRFVRALRGAEAIPWRTASRLLRGWSLLTAAYIVLALVKTSLGHDGWDLTIILLVAFNALLFLRAYPTVKKRVAPWKTVSAAVDGCLGAARQGARDLPAETQLGTLRQCFAEVADRSALPALRGRVGWADSGGLIHALFNAAFFWDLHVAEAILGCVLERRDPLLRGISALADLEVLCSLGCFAAEQPAAGYPTTSDQRVIRIRGGRHPLIAPQRVVPNDVELSDAPRMWVITGSNMSGKSTLLRMAGVNCLLAQTGTVASAEEMTCCPVRLITDLQVRDNLGGDESYFLAEVRHLRRLVCPESNGHPVFGLIDEPFRGTNSADQTAASIALVEHLMASPHLFLVATHDESLTRLADGAAAGNYHFAENLRAEGLIFDYRLRPGAAQTRNALRILEREGYPESLVERARQRLARGENRESSGKGANAC